MEVDRASVPNKCKNCYKAALRGACKDSYEVRFDGITVTKITHFPPHIERNCLSIFNIIQGKNELVPEDAVCVKPRSFKQRTP